MASNPYLTEIQAHLQAMTPGAQAAVKMANPALANPQPATPAPGMLLPPPGAMGSSPMIAVPQSAPRLVTGPDQGQTVMSNGDSVPRGGVLGEKAEQGRLLREGSGISQISGNIQNSRLGEAHPLLGKVLGGLAQGAATIGDVGLSAVAPEVAVNLPGTSYHHQALVNQEDKQVNAANENAKDEAQTANLNLQPQLKAAQGELNQEKQNEVESQHQAVNQNNADKLKSTLAQHGFAEDEQNPGQLRPLKYEEMSEPQQAVHDLNASRGELADATAALKKAQTSGIPAQVQMAQQRIDNARHNSQVAESRLGIQRERMDLMEDKNYNPEPTGLERGKGDLAKSAVLQIGTMRSILASHPEFAGPGADARQAFQRWLSSKGEDAGKFLAAKEYLADHSAAVFGGRSQYITQHLEGLTNSNFSPSTLSGVLDQAENTANGFIKAATPHAKGEKGEAVMPASPSTVENWVRDPKTGKLVKQ